MPSPTSTAEITTLYEDVLFRDPDTGGLNFWANILDSGLLNLPEVTNIFINSPEATNTVDPIIRLYVGLFGRAPDIAGLRGWVFNAEHGMSLNTIVQNFLNQQEFANDYNGGVLGPIAANVASEFITTLYYNFLGRAPDATGLANYVAALGTPTLQSEANVVIGFLNSAEFLNDVETGVVSWVVAGLNAGGVYSDSIVNTAFTVQLTSADNDHIIGASNVSGSLTNSSFDGVGPTLNGGDIVANVVNLTLTDAYGQGVDIIPQGVTLSNITNVILNTAGNAGDWFGTGTFFDVSGISNVKTLTVTSQGGGVDAVNAGATTDISVTHTNTGGFGDSGSSSSESSSSSDYYGGVVVTGGHNVTVTNSGGGGVVIGSDNFDGFSGVPLTSELPTGNVVVNQNAAVTGDVEVFGGVNVTVNVTSDSYNGYIDIGNTGDNTGNFVSGGPTNPTGAIVVVDAAEWGGNAEDSNDTFITVYGGVGTDDTPAVSITAAGDAISVGDSSVNTPSNQPDGDVVIVDTAPVVWGDINGIGQEEDIWVSGGVNVTITTNTGDVYVGDYDEDLNPNDTALTGSQPSGAVNVTDTAVAVQNENWSIVDVHVYGGVGSEGEGGVAAITVNATDANICVGALTFDEVNSVWVAIGPAQDSTGDVVINDGSSANALNIVTTWTDDDDDWSSSTTGVGAVGNIDVIGGHNITITTYVGSVTVGGVCLNVGGTAALAGEEPGGAVNVSDFAQAESTYCCDDCTYYESAICINIYGGTGTVSTNAVTVVATDANINVGTITDGIVLAPGGGPTGNISITNGTSASVWDGTATGAPEGDVSVLGGNSIQITTYVGSVEVGGADLNTAGTGPIAGEEPTGAVIVNDFATDPCANVTVFAGTSVEVTASGASVDVGDVNGSVVIAPSSIIIVTDTATNAYDQIVNCFDNDVCIVGGTSVTVNTNAGGVHIGTSSGVAGSEPSGAISVSDLATGLFSTWCCDNDDITIYGGVGTTGNWAVQVTASDASVFIGAGTASTDPTGGLGVEINIVGVQTANQYHNVIDVAGVGGGGGVTINTTGASDDCDYDAIQIGTATQFNITTTPNPSSNIYYTGGTVTSAGTQSGAVSITDTHSGWNYSAEDILVIGPTTVNINVGLINDCSSVTVGSCPITNGTGQIYLNFADDATGNVSITQSGIENIYNCETDTFTLATVYGDAYDTVYIHGGGTSVSLTGGDGAKIVDVNSLRVEGGPNKGQIVGTSTVTTVSLDGVDGCITITANALQTLNISDATGYNDVESNVSIQNSAPTLALTINLSNATAVNVSDDGLFNPATGNQTPTIVGTVTFTTSGTAPDAIDLDLPLATALVFNNTAELTIDSNFPNVSTITAEGSGQLNLGDLTGSDFAHLKTINASAATGGVSVEITGLQTSFAGGSGNDVVVVDNYATTNPTLMSIDGGGGTNNTVVLTNIAAYYGATDAVVFSGQHFQTLEVDLNGIDGTPASTSGAGFFGAAGFAHLIAGDAGTDGIGFTQVAAGVDLTLIESNTQSASGANPSLNGYATIGYELATYSATGQLNLTMGTANSDGITDAVATGAGGGLDPALNGSTLTGSIPTVSITSVGDGWGSNELYLTDAAFDANPTSGGNFAGTTTIDIGGNESIYVYDTDGTVKTIDASASTADFVDVTGVVTADATFTGGSATLYASAYNVSSANTTPYQDHDVFNLGTGGGWVVVGAGGAGGPDAYFDANTGSEVINLTVNSPIGTTIVAPEIGFVGPSSADFGVYATVNNFTFGTVANHDTASTFVLGAYSIGDGETLQDTLHVAANSTSSGVHGINSDTSVIYLVIDGMVVPTGNPTLTGSAEFADVQAILDADGAGTVGFAVIPSYGSGTVANTTYIIEVNGSGGAADTVIALPGTTTATGFGIGFDPDNPGNPYNLGAGTSLNLGIEESAYTLLAGVSANNLGSATGATYNDGFTLGSNVLGLYAVDTLALSGTGTNVYQNMANWAILHAVSATGGGFSGNGNVTVTQTGIDPILTFDVETSGVAINTFTYGNTAVANDDPLLVLQLGDSLTINTLVDQTNTGTEIGVVTNTDPDLTIGAISDTALVTFDASDLNGALTLGTNADPIGSGLGGNSVNNDLTILASTDVSGCGAIIYASGNGDVIQAGSICDLEGMNPTNGGVIIGAGGTADTVSVYLDGEIGGPGALIGAGGNGDTITLVGGACEMPCFFTPAGDAQTASGVLSAAGTVESAYDLAYITLGGTEGNDGCPLGPPTLENAADTSLGANTVVNIGDCHGCVDTQAIVWLGPDNTVNLSGNCNTNADIWVTSDYANANGHAGTSADFSFETVNWQGGNLSLYFYNEPTESWASGCAASSVVNVAGAGSLANAIDTAAAEAVVLDNNFNDGTNTGHSYSINGQTGLLDWFQYGGNTYIVEANNDATTAATHTGLQGHDVVVELIGLVNPGDINVHLAGAVPV